MIDGLYSIKSFSQTNGSLEAKVVLNKNHAIYQAHFPGHPITPGVCVQQIAQELLEKHFQHKLMMTGAKNIKFLKVISPVETPEIELDISITEKDGIINASTQIVDGGERFVKMSTEYRFE
jgi:3-hydroxyacyl-[acyl-carrier-protein] dehydratase